MDRPLEMKKDKVWSLCKDCWSFNAQQRPSFTEIRERLEKILDKTQRRLPRLRVSELGALNTSIASDSSDSGYSDMTLVYVGYFRCDARIRRDTIPAHLFGKPVTYSASEHNTNKF